MKAFGKWIEWPTEDGWYLCADPKNDKYRLLQHYDDDDRNRGYIEVNDAYSIWPNHGWLFMCVELPLVPPVCEEVVW